MKTITHHPATEAEKQYDQAVSAFQEYDSRDNEEALFLAKVALNKARKHDREQEEKILKDLNRHLDQGRLPQQLNLSEGVVSAVMLLLSTLAFGWVIWWLIVHSVVAR